MEICHFGAEGAFGRFGGLMLQVFSNAVLALDTCSNSSWHFPANASRAAGRSIHVKLHWGMQRARASENRTAALAQTHARSR